MFIAEKFNAEEISRKTEEEKNNSVNRKKVKHLNTDKLWTRFVQLSQLGLFRRKRKTMIVYHFRFS